MTVTFTPIGEIAEVSEPPREGQFFMTRQDQREKLLVYPEHREGLTGLEPGQRLQIIFYFHKSKDFDYITFSHGQQKRTGVFNCRSPRRPNGIGIDVVELLAIEDGVLTIDGADMLPGTPILDIKPMGPGKHGNGGQPPHESGNPVGGKPEETK